MPLFPVRLVLFFLLQAALASPLTALLLIAARRLSTRLPGARGTDAPESQPPWPTAAELQTHDESIAWPPQLAELPDEWRRAAAGHRASKRPFFLNHVRGSLRFKQAMMRVGAASASLLLALILCRLEGRQLAALGLAIDSYFVRNLGVGLLLGFAQITALFLCEWRLGWLAINGTFEVFAPGESFSLNILCEVIFHAAVTINEELPLRGWVLLNSAAACVGHFGFRPEAGLLVAAGLQSLLFSLAHANSPGASRVGLINIAIGGFAAACNLLASGSLALPLGWHFAWNVTMGNVYGLSTSGIPISATLIAAVPHPAKAHLHGGEFGPEQSPLAPVVYAAGAIVVILLYGWHGAPDGFTFPASGD